MTTASETKELLNPMGEIEPLDMGLAPRLGDLNGKVVGFLDNSKDNANMLLAKVEKLLSERYKLAGVFKTRKRTASGPADEMAELEKCDAVVNGIGL